MITLFQLFLFRKLIITYRLYFSFLTHTLFSIQWFFFHFWCLFIGDKCQNRLGVLQTGGSEHFRWFLSIKDGGLIAEDFHASKMAELICRVEISCPGCQHPSLLRDWDWQATKNCAWHMTQRPGHSIRQRPDIGPGMSAKIEVFLPLVGVGFEDAVFGILKGGGAWSGALKVAKSCNLRK